MPGPANSLNISQPGIVVFDGVSNFLGRTLTAGSGISISSGTGISANPIISALITTDLHTARYIVSAGGATDGANYTTIATAYAAAVAAGGAQTVFIQPGTYTENLTLSPSVNLASFDCDSMTPSVTIIGKLTMTAAGTVSITGIRLQTNADYVLQVTGANAIEINLLNCYINATNANGINNANANAGINLWRCFGNCSTNTFFIATAGSIKCFYCILTGNNTVANSTFTNANFELDFTYMSCPITTSGTGSIGLFKSQLICANTTALTHGGSGASILDHSRIESGTATAISIGGTLPIVQCSVFSTNAATIAGAGTLLYNAISFYGASSTSNITTAVQTPLVMSNNAVRVTTPGAYPYTTIPQDNVILVDTSAARTIVPLASPTTGQMHRIKDNAGSAAANNITVTPSGKNIDGSASFLINTNYGSIDIVYNGAQWNIL